MIIKILKFLGRKVPHINVTLARDYLRNLGLACVMGSTSGFFLKSNNSHQLTSLAILFWIGVVSSYFGITKENKND